MAGEPGEQVPAALLEDVEDLKAELAAVKARLATLTGGYGPGTPLSAPDPATAPPAADPPAPGEWKSPPFILLLDPPAYDDELRALIEWVEGVLVPAYLAEPSADTRWCHLWFDHPVALARLHALWLAWQELTDPAVCGYLGPSSWHRDHLDPTIRELRASTGPFAGCTKGEHQVMHRLPGTVPSAWAHDAD